MVADWLRKRLPSAIKLPPDSFQFARDHWEATKARGPLPDLPGIRTKALELGTVIEGPKWGGAMADDYFGIAAKLRKEGRLDG